MNIQRFTAPTAREALAKARMAFGDGTLILSNRQTPQGVEVMATSEETLASLDQTAATPAAPAPIGPSAPAVAARARPTPAAAPAPTPAARPCPSSSGSGTGSATSPQIYGTQARTPSTRP